MSNPAGILVPKSRLIGAGRKADLTIPKGATLSGASGSVGRELGVVGGTGHDLSVHVLEYVHDNITGTPRLVIGIKRGGDMTRVADAVNDPLGELSVIFCNEVLADANSNVLQTVDLSAFTDEQREINTNVGDRLIAAMVGDNGAWVCPYIAIGAMGLEKEDSVN